jgi:hypothetical protein
LCLSTIKSECPLQEGEGTHDEWYKEFVHLEFIVTSNFSIRGRKMFSMKSVESFCKKAIEMGVERAKIIDPGSIVIAEWVRLKCQYECPGFGMSLCCPPRTDSPKKVDTGGE